MIVNSSSNKETIFVHDVLSILYLHTYMQLTREHDTSHTVRHFNWLLRVRMLHGSKSPYYVHVYTQFVYKASAENSLPPSLSLSLRALFGHHDNNPNEIEVIGCGTGDPEEMANYMEDSQNMYGLGEC